MYTGRSYKNKIKCFIVGMLLVTTLLGMGVLFSGCGKQHKNIRVFEYETGDNGKVTITGLTDKGKDDTKLTVPATIDGKAVATIGAGVFRDDSNITDVVIEDGVERISENAFMNCTSLENITIPQSVNNIGTNAFENSAWQNKILENANEVIVNNILVKVKEGIKEYAVPAEVNAIGIGVFYNNKDIVKITFNNKLEEIGDYCFSDCSALTQVQLPSGIKSIGYCAFNNCTSLTIEVPAGVERIGQDAFANVKNVSYISK